MAMWIHVKKHGCVPNASALRLLPCAPPSLCTPSLAYCYSMSQEDAAKRSAADAAAAATRITELERQLAALQRAGAERDAALAQARAQVVQTEERLRELEEEGPRGEQVGLGPRRMGIERSWAGHEVSC